MSFIFGGDTGTSYDDLKRKRALAARLMQQNSSRAPRNVGEGIHAIARGLVARGVGKQADAAKEKLDGQWKEQVQGMGLDPARAAIFASLAPEQRNSAALGWLDQQDAQRRAAARSGAAAANRAAKEAEAQRQQQAIIQALQPSTQPKAGVQMGPTMAAANAGAQSGADLGALQTQQVQRGPNEMLAQMLTSGVPVKDAFSMVEAYQDLQPEPVQQYKVVSGADLGFTGKDAEKSYNVAPDGKITAIGGGGVTVNTGDAPRPEILGTQGLVAIPDPTVSQGYRIEPAPGSPLAQEKIAAEAKKATRESLAETSSDVVVSSASRARAAAQNRAVGGRLGEAAGIINPASPNAEIVRQVATLQSMAAAENINAMRQASPTGGALGNASDADILLLKQKSGSLDPLSPNFIRDLDDYERTLLRTIHGKEAGDEIFDATRGGDVTPEDNIPTFNEEKGVWE